MSRRYKDNDYPSIGDIRGGFIFVCHGDDRPTNCISWLEPLVCEIEKFINLSEDFGIPLKVDNKSDQITSIFDFLDHIGVEIDSNPWSSDLMSGNYSLGWIKKGKIRQSQTIAKKLLKKIEALLNSKIRNDVLNNLKSISDLDEFIDRTIQDPKPLQQSIEEQKIIIADLRDELRGLKVEVKSLKDDRSTKFSESLLELAVKLVSKQKTCFIVGPFALWDDGNLYVLKVVGKSVLPANIQFDRILQIAKSLNFQIIDVHETTIIDGWINGPVYRSIDDEIVKWINAWEYKKNPKRKFVTNPINYEETAYKISVSFIDFVL
jgi:hypothetical protein